MKLRAIIDEDFSNYRHPAMFLASCFCDFKCCVQQGLPVSVCQNAPVAVQPIIEVSAEEILRRYRENPIAQAVVIGGLEPLLQFDELTELIRAFRENGENAAFVIYTGYYPDEISEQTKSLMRFPNIIMKFGRFIPDQEPHYDDILGVMLASYNQYGIKIS
jgi:organic radical activating enzyme